MKLNMRLALPVLGLLSCGQVAHASGFTYLDGIFTTIDVPGSNITGVSSLNDSGQVVGTYLDSTGAHGFSYSNGIYTTINVPGASDTHASGINDRGQIVGQTSSSYGFLDTNGVFTILHIADAVYISPSDINDSGQTVGVYQTSTTGPYPFEHTFLYSNGIFTTIRMPNDTFIGGDINDLGQILGSYEAATSVISGYLSPDGVFTTVDLSGLHANVSAINDSEEIVGTFQDANEQIHGFIYTNGIVSTFDAPGVDPQLFGTELFDINDSGELLGAIVPQVMPTPEPSSILLIGIGLAGLAVLKSKAMM